MANVLCEWGSSEDLARSLGKRGGCERGGSGMEELDGNVTSLSQGWWNWWNSGIVDDAE